MLVLVLGRDGTSRSSLLADRAKRMVREFPMPESAISNSRRPRRSRVGIRARLRQPYGERLAPHSAGRSHDMPPHVPIGVGFRRWRGKVKRRVCNAGRVVASAFVGGRSTTIIAGPVDRHCRALSGWARSYSVWTGPIVDALPILRISME